MTTQRGLVSVNDRTRAHRGHHHFQQSRCPRVITHVAFLRGMNVGGHRITNTDLQRCISAMGFRDVTPYQASGNVLFGADDDQPSIEVEALLARELERSLGYAVPAFVRSAAEVGRIASFVPFPAEAPKPGGKLQVMFLAAVPPPAAADSARSLATDEDQLAIDKAELYWQPAGGVSDSELDFKRIERAIGPVTVRTMGTIQRIAGKLL